MDSSEISAIIDGHIPELDRPGVLSLRPGFQITDGWLTGRRAIVVTVVSKHDAPAGLQLPRVLGGVPVDVRQASPTKRQSLERPAEYAAELRLSPDAGAIPHFAAERTVAGSFPANASSAHAQLARTTSTKTELAYTAPAGAALTPVTNTVTLQLAASPDAGWPTLQPFLAGTTERLTVGLYDFTSAHVLAAVETALTGRTLTLTLDHPSLNASADQTDADTVAALTTALGAGLTQAWALTRTDPDATAWIYPTAYHIKVAVRDGTSVWLSSGNWNNSNQPDINPVTTSTDAEAARHGDRDWHVIATSPALAATFEAYLLHDEQEAAANNGPPEAAGAPLPAPTPSTTETPAFAEFFAAATVTGEMTLTPLLTPDPGVYVGAIKALIESAVTSLYLQYQYIEMPTTVDSTSQAFADLVTAVVARQTAGVDVKIIMSEYETAGYLEQLQTAGLDVVTNVKIQNNVHNKGIIVDGSTVLISSQNWSTDGTLYNRDAGLIVANADAAAYFQQIFLHDWDNLASQKASSD